MTRRGRKQRRPISALGRRRRHSRHPLKICLAKTLRSSGALASELTKSRVLQLMSVQPFSKMQEMLHSRSRITLWLMSNGTPHSRSLASLTCPNRRSG